MSTDGSTPTRELTVRRFVDESRAWIDGVLEEVLSSFSSSPRSLVDAMRYALLGGGKRLRPAFARALCHHYGGSDENVALPAAAVECVHAYSLVHDDLPSMDDDDLRRGRPTCHKVYGEALAILAGEALLTLSFELVARTGARAADHARVLAIAAGHAGMVGGQVLDLAAETALAGETDVGEIHARKTAALFGAAAEMGAIAAGAPGPARALARNYGQAIGRCFQATDDILDVTGDAGTLGKTPGKDARGRKPTLVAALGLEGARIEAERLADVARAAAAALPARPGDLSFEMVERILHRPA